jgi:prophage antirepressor-like protein
MNNLTVQKFQDHDIRNINREGNLWFVAKDICDVLEIQNSSDALTALDEDEKGVGEIYTLGGPQNMSIISESGLYTLLVRSNKTQAKPFRKWVTQVVLPTIRKTGAYMSRPMTQLEMAEAYLESVKAQMRLEETNVKLLGENKALSDVIVDNHLMDFATFAKSSAKCIAMKIGRNDLFKLLRNKNILKSNNIPYQHFVDSGYFEVKQIKIDSLNETKSKTFITKKGIVWVEKQF